MIKGKTINVQGAEITLMPHGANEYISLTDIARSRNTSEPYSLINNWMRNRSTIEFIGLWEQLFNPDFKPTEFGRYKNEAGSNYFVLSPQKWIETTGAIGITSKSGRYGGTFAHKDIAFEFATWISSEFKLYLIIEFQRLKEEGNKKLSSEWNLHRTLAKINYHIQNDAIKEKLIPKELSRVQIGLIYASEADLLNMAIFGRTAKEWRDEHPGQNKNLRDDATMEQLVVLSNLESLNSVLILQGLNQADRLKQLNAIAIVQMKSLLSRKEIMKLK